MACDVRDYDQVDKVIKTTQEKLGPINILLNNAAGNFVSPTERLSHRAFDTVVDIVLKGTYNFTLCMGKGWIAQKKTGTILNDAICSMHINRIVKQAAKDAMFANADQVSAHSLRRGFATEAARLGASMPAIQKHGRWKSTKTVFEYIEAGRQFKDSAVNVMFGEN